MISVLKTAFGDGSRESLPQGGVCEGLGDNCTQCVCACVVCTCVYTHRYSILRSLSKKNTKRYGGAGQVGVILLSQIIHAVNLQFLSLFLSISFAFHQMLFRALAPQARSPLLISTSRGHASPPPPTLASRKQRLIAYAAILIT